MLTALLWLPVGCKTAASSPAPVEPALAGAGPDLKAEQEAAAKQDAAVVDAAADAGQAAAVALDDGELGEAVDRQRAVNQNVLDELVELRARVAQLESMLGDHHGNIGDILQRLTVQEEQVDTFKHSLGEGSIYDTRVRSLYRGRPRHIQLTGTKTELEFGGQIWMDVIQDNQPMLNEAGFSPSSIPTTGSGRNQSTLGAGQSKLFVKSVTPTDSGDIKTRFEFDMFQTDGSADFHSTHYWAEWNGVGVGQTFSNFMDITSFPSILDYWGPNGMVFIRQPQVRFTHITEGGWELAASIEDATSDPTLPAGVVAETREEMPDLVASARLDGEQGHVKLAGLVRKISYEPMVSAGLRDDVTGWGLNASGSLNVFEDDQIVGQFAYGEGIGRYINDTCCFGGGNDAAPDASGNLQALETFGGFVYYNHWWSEAHSS
ncbi:MAG: hypothetical protein DRQ55_14585, partial [Planctomycetota bacterium]